MEDITNEATENGIKEMKKPQEILAEAICNRAGGEAVTHEEIEKIIGVSRKLNPRDYYKIVNNAKEILQNQYGKTVESMPKVGYRFLKPGDYVGNALRHYKRGFREIKKGKDTLEIAPVADMSVEERASYTRVYDKSIILHASMEGALCELKALGKKPPHPFLGGNSNNLDENNTPNDSVK